MPVELDTNEDGAIDIALGGTGAKTAEGARVAIGAEAVGAAAAAVSSHEVEADPHAGYVLESGGLLTNYAETRADLGTLGASATIDLANGNYFEGTVGASNVTLTLPAAPSTGLTKSFTVAIKQHASAAKTVSFSGGAGVKWLSTTTAASSTVDKWTVWSFFYSQTEAKWLSTGAVQEP